MEDKYGGFDDDPPSAKALDSGGYNQTYIVLKSGTESGFKSDSDGREVLFRCGNWCYAGQIQFGNLVMGLVDLPIIIPTLQKQQGSLRYYCNSNTIPRTSNFAQPIDFVNKASDFFAAEVISEPVEHELRKMASIFPWIDDDNSATYFELSLTHIPEYLSKVDILASKTYTRGLIIISIYFEQSIYFVIQSGEGDQALLDIRFPNVSQHGQGILLGAYDGYGFDWKRLTLWHILSTETSSPRRAIPKIKTFSISTTNYEQTYCIMKSNQIDPNSPNLSVHHDVLFRFGSWCYSGRVQLVPSLSLADVPFVIPALRMQQSRLDFLCDVGAIPTTSPFAATLKYIHKLTPFLETEIASSEDVMRELIERLSSMGLGESVAKWLDGDPANSFFEFKFVEDSEYEEVFRNMELVAAKSYHASGIVTVTIIFQQSIYVSVLDGTNENPLLDSRFPDISGKGRGYQIATYPTGRMGWPSLRKVSVWQTVGALEQEFRERASQYAQSKQLSLGEQADENLEAQPQEKETDFVMADAKSSPLEVADKENPIDKVIAPQETVSDRLDGSPSADEKRSSGSRSPTSSAGAQQKIQFDRSPTMDDAAVLAGSKSSPGEEPSEPRRTGLADVARPHHIPKLDGLSNRLDDIKKKLGSGGLVAPWDATGKPLLGGLKK